MIALSEGVTELIVEEPRTRTVMIKHIVGYPFGMITGYKQKTDGHGNLVFNPTVPLQEEMSTKSLVTGSPILQAV